MHWNEMHTGHTDTETETESQTDTETRSAMQQQLSMKHVSSSSHITKSLQQLKILTSKATWAAAVKWYQNWHFSCKFLLFAFSA